jgi:hypothetical protein
MRPPLFIVGPIFPEGQSSKRGNFFLQTASSLFISSHHGALGLSHHEMFEYDLSFLFFVVDDQTREGLRSTLHTGAHHR